MQYNSFLYTQEKNTGHANVIPITQSNTTIYVGRYSLGVYTEPLRISSWLMLILNQFVLQICLLHVNASRLMVCDGRRVCFFALESVYYLRSKNSIKINQPPFEIHF
jgi:hypothetical protein